MHQQTTAFTIIVRFIWYRDCVAEVGHPDQNQGNLLMRHEGSDLLGDGRMGLAAGGKISQKIYEDKYPPWLYDEDAVQRVFIHTVTTTAWEVSVVMTLYNKRLTFCLS